jgi:hypothetical protein
MPKLIIIFLAIAALAAATACNPFAPGISDGQTVDPIVTDR